jgi:hypothetical protein
LIPSFRQFLRQPQNAEVRRGLQPLANLLREGPLGITPFSSWHRGRIPLSGRPKPCIRGVGACGACSRQAPSRVRMGEP